MYDCRVSAAVLSKKKEPIEIKKSSESDSAIIPEPVTESKLETIKDDSNDSQAVTLISTEISNSTNEMILKASPKKGVDYTEQILKPLKLIDTLSEIETDQQEQIREKEENNNVCITLEKEKEKDEDLDTLMNSITDGEIYDIEKIKEQEKEKEKDEVLKKERERKKEQEIKELEKQEREKKRELEIEQESLNEKEIEKEKEQESLENDRKEEEEDDEYGENDYEEYEDQEEEREREKEAEREEETETETEKESKEIEHNLNIESSNKSIHETIESVQIDSNISDMHIVSLAELSPADLFHQLGQELHESSGTETGSDRRYDSSASSSKHDLEPTVGGTDHQFTLTLSTIKSQDGMSTKGSGRSYGPTSTGLFGNSPKKQNLREEIRILDENERELTEPDVNGKIPIDDYFQQLMADIASPHEDSDEIKADNKDVKDESYTNDDYDFDKDLFD